MISRTSPFASAGNILTDSLFDTGVPASSKLRLALAGLRGQRCHLLAKRSTRLAWQAQRGPGIPVVKQAPPTHQTAQGIKLIRPMDHPRVGDSTLIPDISLVGYKSDNNVSRLDPARGPRKLPTAPGDPRKATGETPCSRRNSPPFPAQSGNGKTGLSRRRSRVRVPSLPLKHPANRYLLLSHWA